MAEGFSSPIDIGLSANPNSLENEIIYEEFTKVYNAIRILQQKLGDFAGVGVLDPANYLTLNPIYGESIQVHRMQAIIVTSADAIAAKHFVNLYNVAGALRARRADATAIGTRAHGWAPEAISNGDEGIIFLNSGFETGGGLTLGATYYLSASSPGGISTVPPGVAGNIKQEIGFALSASDLAVRLSTPIVI
jgi:hypothetical protein